MAYEAPAIDSIEFNLQPTGYEAPAIDSIEFEMLAGTEIITSALLDCKLIIRSNASNNVDGSLVIKSADSSLIDGKLRLQSDTTDTLDGYLNIVFMGQWQDYFDGVVDVVVGVQNVFDGTVDVKDSATSVLDGKCYVVESTTVYFDGTFDVSDEIATLFDGYVKVYNRYIKSVIDQVWGLQVQTEVDEEYPLNASVESSLDEIWGLQVQAYVNIPYGDLPVITHVSYQPYGNCPIPQVLSIQPYADVKLSVACVSQPYGNMVPAKAVMQEPYDLNEALSTLIQQPYSLVDGSDVLSTSDQVYDIEENHKITSSSDQIYSLQHGGAVLLSNSITAHIDDEVIALTDITINTSMDSYVFQFDIEVASEEDYLKCQVGSIMTVDVLGVEYTLRLDTRTRSRGANDDGSYEISYQLQGFSPAIVLDSPHAATITKTWEEAILASAVVAEVAPGFDIEWTAEDWTIAAGIMSVENMTPIQVIRKIADAIGASVGSTADGKIKVFPYYKYNTDVWDVSSVDSTIPEYLIFSETEETEYRTGFNAFVVTDYEVSADSQIWITEDTDDAGQILLKVFQVPWTGSFAVFTSSSNASITSVVDVTEEITEEVEFVNGVSRTTHPIYVMDETSFDWNTTDLGIVSYLEDGSLTSSVLGNSLLTLTYTTKYRRMVASSSVADTVQFYTEDT